MVLTGKKTFDLRAGDFEVCEGDTLILEEWDPKTGKYTGRMLEKTVGYVLKLNLDDFGQRELIVKNGIVVIQLSDRN